MLEAAASRVPKEFYVQPPPFKISVANADGVEIAHCDAGKWTWRADKAKPELNLCAFYVTFRAGEKIVTVCVDCNRV